MELFGLTKETRRGYISGVRCLANHYNQSPKKLTDEQVRDYFRHLLLEKKLAWSPGRCVPHGGHQFALHIAAGLGLGGNESYPGIFQPFGGFADHTPIKDGRISLTEIPGIGFEAKSGLMDLFINSLDTDG